MLKPKRHRGNANRAAGDREHRLLTTNNAAVLDRANYNNETCLGIFMHKIAPIAVGLMALFNGAAIAADTETGPQPAVSSGTPPALEELVVTGSRIPRTAVDGPAPVVTITAADITNNGFATISDVMTSLTQNLGALDNNQ